METSFTDKFDKAFDAARTVTFPKKENREVLNSLQKSKIVQALNESTGERHYMLPEEFAINAMEEAFKGNLLLCCGDCNQLKSYKATPELTVSIECESCGGEMQHQACTSDILYARNFL